MEAADGLVVVNVTIFDGCVQEFLCFRQKTLKELDLGARKTAVDEPKPKRDNSADDANRARHNTINVE